MQFNQLINMRGNPHYEQQVLSPYTPYTSKIAFKKDFFIQSRQEDIRKFYDFYPKPIGRGGYGTVYKAKLKEPPYSDRVVKVINKRLIRNPQVLMNEVNVLRRLDHPNIIRLYQSFEDKGYLYLVTDICEGGQLFDRIDQVGSFDEAKARYIFTQIVKTIKYLHLQKICHRDLKAQNFLFSKPDDDLITLIDFGMAFPWKEDMRVQLVETGNNKLVGTSYYVAPEVISKNYDQRSDIWSLGVLLHVIVSASPPFGGDDDTEILQNVKSCLYLENQEIVKLSGLLRDLIRKILVPAEKRLSLDGILEHPWVKSGIYKSPRLPLDFKKMSEVVSFSKLKTVVAAFISAQLPAKDIQNLSLLFKQIDTSNDGFLSVPEMEIALKNQGIELNSKDLHRMMKAMDLDKNGLINFNEFLAAMTCDDYCERKDYLEYIFKYFDADKNGKISFKELQMSIQKMGIELPEKFLKQLIDEADIDKDSEISYEQFWIAMKKREA